MLCTHQYGETNVCVFSTLWGELKFLFVHVHMHIHPEVLRWPGQSVCVFHCLFGYDDASCLLASAQEESAVMAPGLTLWGGSQDFIPIGLACLCHFPSLFADGVQNPNLSWPEYIPAHHTHVSVHFPETFLWCCQTVCLLAW